MENQTPEIIVPQQQKFNPILWIVIGVAILAVGIGVGLVFGKYSSKQNQLSTQPVVFSPTSFPTTTPTETTDHTANWKTYSSQKYGISIKYPPVLNITEHASDEYLLYLTFDPSEEIYFAKFQVKERSKLADAVEFKKREIANSVYENGESIPHKILSEQETTHPNANGTKITYELGPQNLVTIILNNNKYSYFITSSPERIDQILSTFKFTQ